MSSIALSLSLRSRLLSGVSVGVVDPYAVASFSPDLVFDFEQEYYRTGGTTTTFDDAMTFSRDGNATMVDSDGLLKWAPHNLLLRSEEFDSVSWLKSGLLAFGSGSVANAVSAPDGTVTADAVIPSADANAKIIYQAAISLAAGYRSAVFVKSAGWQWIGIRPRGGNGQVQSFDIINGVKGLASAAILDSSITPMGDGWYLIEARTELGDGLYVQFADNDTTATNPTVTTADGTSGIYIWGAHLYRSDLGGMVSNPDQPAGFETYVPTTSAARHLPRRGHHIYNGAEWVNEGVLVESEARTNLQTYSNDFTNAVWSKTNSTVAASLETSPSGTTDAFTITAATTARTFINSNLVKPTTTFGTGSIYLKAGNTNFACFTVALGTNFQRQWIDLSAGTLGSTTSFSIASFTANVVDAGNGWYRIEVTPVSATTRSTFDLVVDVCSADNVLSADAGDFVHVYQAQYEDTASTASSPIPTSDSTVTRAADTITVPSANLPWPTPNVIGPELVAGGEFNDAGDLAEWTAVDATISIVSGQLQVITGGNAGGAYQALNVTAGSTYLIEASAQKTSGDGTRTVGVNVRSGTTVSSSILSTALSFTNAAPSGVISGSVAYTAATTGTVYIWVIQSQTTTALFDNISVREIDPLAVSIQMPGRMNIADEGAPNTVVFANWNINSSNYIQIIADTTTVGSATDDSFRFAQAALGTADTVKSLQDTVTFGVNVPFNIASRHGSTFINGAIDGTALTVNPTPTALPDLSSTDLSLASDYMGTIKLLRIWADDLGDSGIAEASTNA